jgi:hypothetical protein
MVVFDVFNGPPVTGGNGGQAPSPLHPYIWLTGMGHFQTYSSDKYLKTTVSITLLLYIYIDAKIAWQH